MTGGSARRRTTPPAAPTGPAHEGGEWVSSSIERTGARLSRQYLRERVTGYGFLLPDVVGLLVFVVGPIGFAFYISLHTWSALSPMRWTGFSNYLRLWRDPQFWNSLEITALYTAIFVPLLIVVSLGLAVLVNQRLPFIPIFRAIFFVPVVLSLVVSSLMWRYIFDERIGLLNYLIGLIGIPPQAWLGSVELALPSIIVVSLWIQMGYFMTIFLAGLQDIPKEYYEAAMIDGASSRTAFMRITLPLLKPTTLFVLVISLINSFQVFDQVWVMTRGGPASATQVTVIYIYQHAFQYLNLGYASAMAFVLFVIILVVSLVQFRLFRANV
jgi:multiple sugar transport system permease protein